MPKAIVGAAELAGAIGMGVAAFYDPALLASPLFDKIWAGLVIGGIAAEAGALADALTQNRGMGITTRQPASFRQIIRGTQRVPGVIVYQSTTGGSYDQWNYVIVLATHEIQDIVALYLDGRKVYWQAGSDGQETSPGGTVYGGQADSNTYIGPNGQHYNFGSLVYSVGIFGNQVDGRVVGSLTANDPVWTTTAAGSPWLGGCAYVYLKVEYDAAMFPNPPEIRFTIRGKNDIYDPRTGETGYTENWALHINDAITDSVWSLGDNSVNQDQLIAAANVCDEQVDLAAGGTEDRYALHWHYDTSTAPMDALQTMMPGAGGRLSRVGGEWFIWPAYWVGPGFSCDENSMLAGVQWNPYRSISDLWNRITGTYIAPNYPYNTAGDLYDENGWYDGTIADNWPFAFQPTNYPMYAADTLHGYSSDQYLAQDGGKQLPHELSQQTVLSIAQAQRVAKIALMRNRQQGSASLRASLFAWQMQPVDVMQFTFPALGMEGKYLEVDSLRFKVDTDGDSKGDDAPRIYVELTAIETDPSVYEWSTTEELSVYDVAAAPQQAPYTPVAPTSMTLDSSAATAVVGADGVVTPRVQVSWSAPLDVLVTHILIQYQAVGASSWISAPPVDVSIESAFVAGVIAGVAYNFQIASVRANGAQSPWVQVLNYTVSETLSAILSNGINPNSPYNINNDVVIDSVVDSDETTADIRIYGPGGVGSAWDNFTGQGSATYPSGTITGLTFATVYWVVIDITTGDYSATTDYNDALSDVLLQLGSLTTVASGGTGGTSGGGGGTGGGTPRPITYIPGEG